MSNQSYQVIARKWRPQKFADLTGQAHVARTLQNSLKKGRTGHAYLFVGPRGIGKTTTARIFAKALNCDQGVNQEPCCECQSCREIAASGALDVMEIDGASHNGVDHIRDIRDNVVYTPSRCRYKIYIIDEVHMLTTQAWNALLKTLEEPPPHVKFFFATTEPHKVLPTVVSRCQRFDLRRIPASLIAERLQAIAEAEQVRIQDRAVAAIARAADGSMRDGQSIFDQIISFCVMDDDHDITEQEVIDVFGLASATELKQLAHAIVTNDLTSVIQVVQRVADQGRDLERVYADLLHYTRNLMVCSSCRDPGSFLEVAEEEKQDLEEVAAVCKPSIVTRLLNGLVEAEGEFRHALNKRIALEAILVRLMRETHSLQIDDLMTLLRQYEEQNGPVTVDVSGGEPEPSTPREKKTGESPPPAAAASSVHETNPGQAAAEHETENGDATDSDQSSPHDNTASESTYAAAAPQATSSGEPSVTPQPSEEDADDDNGQPPTDKSEASSHQHPEPPRTPNQQRTTSSEQPATNNQQPTRLWHRLIERMEQQGNAQIATAMQFFIPVAVDEKVFQVAYDENVPEEQLAFLQRQDVSETLQQGLRHELNDNPQCQVLIKRWIADVSSDAGAQRRKRATPEVWENVRNNPNIQKICNMFDAAIIDVRA